METQAIYDRFHLMPNLQEHQRRVAGVADWICARLEAEEVPIERAAAVEACLLHDLGNIVKFDLAYFPEFLEPEGLAFWQKMKDETIAKYGDNAHRATEAMAREIGASERVIALINAISFNRAKTTLEEDDWSAKVCAYSDMRVAPWGVVSMQERLDDGLKRYASRGASVRFSYIVGAFLKKLEKQLEEAGGFKAEEITEEVVAKPK